MRTRRRWENAQMRWLMRRLAFGVQEALERMRLTLSRPDALLTLAVLGLVTGLLAAGVIVAFRWVVESAQSAFLPGPQPENYGGLPPLARVVLPIAGGLIIGGLFRHLAKGQSQVGVVHVMERLAYHQGYLTARAMALQFVGAAVAIISGHSVGREGPSVHLGAASGSLIGQRLALPNNVIRTLVGCGTAAAIAASFHTPLAGVIFSLEVVMMEYTLASFTPVVLAAVSASAVSFAVYGPDPAFELPPMELGSLHELPVVLLLGFAAGTASAAFTSLLQWVVAVSARTDLWVRTTAAGAIVALCALVVPEVMGIGYHTVNEILLGHMGLGLLLGITAVKLVASAASVGLGVPAGLIGPTLVIGAALGGTLGIAAAGLFADFSGSSGVYALLGMGAMMGATLQAPLAALTAVVELTSNTAIIFPAMLAIVVAGLTSSELFGRRSVFIMLLKSRGLDYRQDPIRQALHRVAVAGAMDRNFAEADRRIQRHAALALLHDEPRWILIFEDTQLLALMPGVDLLHYLHQHNVEDIDLQEIPAKRLEVSTVHLQATLQEALDRLDQTQAEALIVERMTAPTIVRRYGVLTREQIEHSYRSR